MKDSIISVQINAELNENVNKIIKEVGLTYSQAVNILYNKIEENDKLPFQVEASK